MRRATETADVSPCALPAVAECTSAMNRSGTVDGAVAAPSTIVQMVGAGRRVLDFGKGGDEVCEIEYILAELGGKGEEAEGRCMGVGGSLITAHCAKSGISCEFLEDGVGFACEADRAACKEGRGGERGQYAMSCFEGGDIADEVEVECRRPDVPEGVRCCKRPLAQDGLIALGAYAEGTVMLVAAFRSARRGVAAGMASFAGGDGEVDGEVTKRGQSGKGEVTESLEATMGAIVNKEAVGGVDVGHEFVVDGVIGEKQGICIAEGGFKSP